jgi:hypothetical protein
MLCVLFLKISKDTVSLPALQCTYPPVLINRLETVIFPGSLLSVLLLDYLSGANLQSSLKLGGQRAEWEDTLILPLFYLTLLVVMASHSPCLLANMPGNVKH